MAQENSSRMLTGITWILVHIVVVSVLWSMVLPVEPTLMTYIYMWTLAGKKGGRVVFCYINVQQLVEYAKVAALLS